MFFFSVDTFWFALLWFGVTQQGKGSFRFFSGDFCFQVQMFWSICWSFFSSFLQNFNKIRYFFSISSKILDMYLILGTRNGIRLKEKDGMGLNPDPSVFLFAVPCTEHILIKTTLQTRYLLLILHFTNMFYLYYSVLRYFKE